MIQDWVDNAVAVTDPEVVAAMKLIFERLKIVVEPSGAVVRQPCSRALLSRLPYQLHQLHHRTILLSGAHSQSRVGLGCGELESQGLAAVLHPDFKRQNPCCENVGVILCGGNIDMQEFFNLIDEQVKTYAVV